MHVRLVDMKFLLVFCSLVSFCAFSQKEKPQNYEAFGVKSLVSESTPGGQLGIVTTLKLGTPVARLRFIPTLSFQERVLKYQFVDDSYTGDSLNVERISSTSLDFPLMFQFRTLRLNNFAAYVLIGGQYSIDLQSQQEASQNFVNPFIKMKKFDFQGQIGGGVEFFAEYFKFGMELKYSHGLRNSFIQDNTPVSNPIDQFYSKGWWFSLIFEG